MPFETAFSATCPTKIIKIDRDKKTRTTSTRPQYTIMVHFYKQQKNLKNHKNQEQAMYDVKHHHQIIIDYARFINKNDMIDECYKNINNMNGADYTDTIIRDLPIQHNGLLMSSQTTVLNCRETLFEYMDLITIHDEPS